MASTAEALNPPRMYRIRPYFEIKKVKLPDCMYLIKPVHSMTNAPHTVEVSSTKIMSHYYLQPRDYAQSTKAIMLFVGVALIILISIFFHTLGEVFCSQLPGEEARVGVVSDRKAKE